MLFVKIQGFNTLKNTEQFYTTHFDDDILYDVLLMNLHRLVSLVSKLRQFQSLVCNQLGPARPKGLL